MKAVLPNFTFILPLTLFVAVVSAVMFKMLTHMFLKTRSAQYFMSTLSQCALWFIFGGSEDVADMKSQVCLVLSPRSSFSFFVPF